MSDARDVSFDVVSNDKTAAGLASAERRLRETNKRIEEESKKTGLSLGKGLDTGVAKAAPRIAANLGEVFSSAGLASGPALAAGLAVGLPLIGAAISGAVIGGAGIGGVLGGVALAARDPRVAATGQVLGRTLMEGLQQDAAVFIEPVIRAADKIEKRFEAMRPRLKAIFADSVDFLDPLLDGALDLVDGVLRGVQSLTDKGGPVIDEFGEGFSRLGDSIAVALDMIAGGSHDAADAVEFMFKLFAAGIEATGLLVRGLTELWGVISYIPNKIMEFRKSLGPVWGETERIGGAGTFAADGLNQTAAAMGNTQANAVELTYSLEDAEKAIADVHRAQLDLYGSTTDVAGALDRANEAIKENGRTLSLNSEKGRENRDALSTVASAVNRQYEAYVKVNGVTPKSAALAEDLRGKFVALAQKAGMSASAAQDLANKILTIPSKRETKITAATTQAKNDIQDVKNRLNEVRSKTVTVTVNVNASRLNKVNQQLERSGGRGFSAANYWSGVNTNDGVSRVGGPAPVSVVSDVAVSLDGAPFYQMSVRAAERVNARAQWRAEVGQR